jgi:hypothetical protein
VATNITVKSPNGESAIYEVSLFDVIDIKKGDYVLVSERPELLGLEIIDDSLKINFPDGNSVVVKDIKITQQIHMDLWINYIPLPYLF